MSSSQYRQILENDMEVLQQLLQQELNRHLHLKADDTTQASLRVLNLACGRADESGMLGKLLRPFSPSL